MASFPSPVDEVALSRLRAALTTRRLGRTLVWLPSCQSTNDEVAARSAAGAEEGLLVAADRQTSGRGRRGRTWHSPPGENLYVSLLLRPALPARTIAPLTLLAGLALAEALARLEFSPRLKWPNDVLLKTAAGPKKVAGILMEMACAGESIRHVVLGVGINVNALHFPDDLATKATSLALVRGYELDRVDVLAAFLNAFEPVYDHFLAHGSADGLSEWHRHALLGQRCFVEREGGRVEGVASHVDETGALLLRADSGNLVPIHAGEVNWIAAVG